MKREHWNSIIYTILSFLIPAFLITVALMSLKVTPFGDETLIISDGSGLYINFLSYVAQVVKGQAGILFSFEKSLGGNLMGSWAWFFLNPFFPLFAFFDITDYPRAYTLVSVLNFCVCGLTMYLLLKNVFGHKFSNLFFSTSYALCGFLVANVFQMNFFTGVSILPLVVLGLRKIFRNKNSLLYIVSLAYSLLTNFYFGFMICAASLLIFLTIFIADRELTDRKSITLRYFASSALGGLLSSFVWLPALLSLRGGRLEQSIAWAITAKENMPFLEMAAKLFTGANNTTELQNGLPNIFVGILPVALVILFFLSEQNTPRRKIAAAALLGIYLISFYMPVLNIAMHGGTVTNWFNYRDSFVFSFLLLMLAAEELEHLVSEPIELLKKTAVFLLCGILIVFSKRYEFVTGAAVLFDLIILAFMALSLWMHKCDPEKNPTKVLERIILVLVCVNLFANYEFSTKKILNWDEKESEYREIVLPVSTLVDAVKKSNADFYRMEVGEQRSGTLGNDPMLYGYNGIGHGGSDDRDYVRNALSKLGIHRYNMRNYYGKGIPASTDTLVGLRYLISKEDLTEEKNFEKLLEFEEWSLYKNYDALPIAFIADAETEKVETALSNVFENLNETWTAISGIRKPVFTEESDISFTSHNIIDPITISREEASVIVESRDAKALNSSSDLNTLNKEDDEIPSYKEPPENKHYIKYTWVADKDGPIYSYNASGMTEENGSILASLIYDGYYHKGDTVTGYLPVTAAFTSQYLLEDVAGRFRAAYADNDALHELATVVKERPCTVEKIKDSHLRGEFTAEDGQLLMFTIPYDEGWTCFIDGKEAEIKQVLGVFMAVDAPAGTHSYEMKFFPVGMKTGIGLSAAALLTTLVYIPLDSRRRKRADAVPETAVAPECQTP